MLVLLHKTMENISSLRYFYDVQKKNINRISKKGMKDNSLGFLISYYITAIKYGDKKEKSKKTFNNLERYVKNYIQNVQIKDNNITFELTELGKKEVRNIAKSSILYRRYAEMPRLHANNTLIMLITRFEEFIADFIKYLYGKYPNKYIDKQNITFCELSNLGIDNVEKIKKMIIDREVDKVMRDSFSSWFDLFQEHKIKIDCCSKEYQTLRELYARRNILVHNSGIVNDSYIKAIPNSTFQIGQNLYIDDEYLNLAFDTIKTIIYCISIEGLKLDKDSAKDNINGIFLSAFEELLAENYNISRIIFKSIQNSAYSDEVTKQMSKVNYWISIKESNEFESIKSEIMSFDVSALDEIFLLAKQMLLKQFAESSSLIEKLLSQNRLSFSQIEQWPLFKDYRKSTEYSEFKTSHPHFSRMVELDTTDNQITNEETINSVKTELRKTETDKKGVDPNP